MRGTGGLTPAVQSSPLFTLKEPFMECSVCLHSDVLQFLQNLSHHVVDLGLELIIPLDLFCSLVLMSFYCR